MKTIQKVIQAGFAACALASASLPALSWTVWPDVDFEWYANAGKPPAGAATVDFPKARVGEIWVPSHYERTSKDKHAFVRGHWIKDDYFDQVAIYSAPGRTTIATGPTTLYDSQGNRIPTEPEAYPIRSASR